MRLAKAIASQRGLLVSIAKTWHGHRAAELVLLEGTKSSIEEFT